MDAHLAVTSSSSERESPYRHINILPSGFVKLPANRTDSGQVGRRWVVGRRRPSYAQLAIVALDTTTEGSEREQHLHEPFAERIRVNMF
ncbi:hypothetical protein GWI33_017798 [Rhynchophorus ferrugineus]|uniref:Uncharacterized protein n=1 Tax=Rhynchophorus ferrugineus TaxID=354439 RepID=A0A834HXL3_RHYFE|nr:hypothetical protein GWI33_017798 [Rhynchophorus ferrugineus]